MLTPTSHLKTDTEAARLTMSERTRQTETNARATE